MQLKRLFILVLTLILVLGVISIGAYAAQPEVSDEPELFQIPFQVNPLYKDQYAAGNLPLPEADPYSGEAEFRDPKDPGITFGTEADAALQLRDAMKDRTTTLTLYIHSSDFQYEKIMNTVLQLATVHTGDPEEGDYLLWNFMGWGGQVYRSSEHNTWYYQFDLTLSYYTTRAQEREVNSTIDRFIKNNNLKKASDIEKIRTVYGYICDNVSYDYENLNDPGYTLKFSAYAALINRRAVCQGYASLLYRMLLELNVDCRVFAGETSGGPHAWNIIRVGDLYYYADATWDSGLEEYQYFLKCSENFPDHYRYVDYATLDYIYNYPIGYPDYTEGTQGQPDFYLVSGKCGEDAYFVLDRGCNLTISGTGAMEDYYTNSYIMYSEGSPIWQLWSEIVLHITIEEGITSIGENAFVQMRHVVSAKLPSTLTKIGRFAFMYCTSLEEIHIPDGVSQIGKEAFLNCQSLRVATLGSSLKEMPMYLFSGCISLESIEIPATVKRFDYSPFLNCHSLTEIRFLGSAPWFDTDRNFEYMTATAYYPTNDKTWTSAVRAHAGPYLNWVPYCRHEFEESVLAPSCVQDGAIVNTCTVCGETESRFNGYATGLHLFSDDADTTCDTCGFERPIRESRPVVHMFRMYDPNSGEHFYTGSEEERDNLISAGWNYEGVGFTFPLTTGDPVHRLYDPVYGEHLYTMDEAEMNALLEAGWNYEGIAFNSAFEDEVPQYRLHNPNANRGAYHFTSSIEERDFLISVGWEYQGIGWYSCWK